MWQKKKKSATDDFENIEEKIWKISKNVNVINKKHLNTLGQKKKLLIRCKFLSKYFQKKSAADALKFTCMWGMVLVAFV